MMGQAKGMEKGKTKRPREAESFTITSGQCYIYVLLWAKREHLRTYSVVFLHVPVDESNSTLWYPKLQSLPFLPTHTLLRICPPFTCVRDKIWGREEDALMILDNRENTRKRVIKPTLVASMMILLIFSLSKPCIPALLSLRPILSRTPSLQELLGNFFMLSIVLVENEYLF